MSPKLLNCKDLELAVPGTYDPFTETVCIKAVVPSLQVITSKQRPRKLKIHGKAFHILSCQRNSFYGFPFAALQEVMERSTCFF